MKQEILPAALKNVRSAAQLMLPVNAALPYPSGGVNAAGTSAKVSHPKLPQLKSPVGGGRREERRRGKTQPLCKC